VLGVERRGEGCPALCRLGTDACPTRGIMGVGNTVAYSRSASEKMERQIPDKAAKAIKAAYKLALNSGDTVLAASNGLLYQVSVDGKKTVVKTIGKPFPVAIGTKRRIR